MYSCICVQNLWKISVKEFNFSKVADLKCFTKFTGSHKKKSVVSLISEGKYFSYILLTDHISLFLWDIEQYVYCNCLLIKLWRHKFWNEPYFLIEPFFLHDLKIKKKNLNNLRTKRAFKMKRHLLSFLAFIEAHKTNFYGRWGSGV